MPWSRSSDAASDHGQRTGTQSEGAGVAVGADGLIVEVHDQPEKALSDGAQALTLDQYDQLIQEVRPIHEVVAPQPVG